MLVFYYVLERKAMCVKKYHACPIEAIRRLYQELASNSRQMLILNIRNTLDTSAFVLEGSVPLSDKSFRHIIPSQILIPYSDLFLRMKI